MLLIAIEVLSVQQDTAGLGLIEALQQPHAGGLPRAVGPHQGRDLSGLQLQGQILGWKEQRMEEGDVNREEGVDCEE